VKGLDIAQILGYSHGEALVKGFVPGILVALNFLFFRPLGRILSYTS
jgi:hypothetical protein